MKVALIGTTGFVGKAILNELLSRNHEVLGIARKPEDVKESNPNLILDSLDVNDEDALAEGLKNYDAVISAFNAGWTNPNFYDDFIKGSKAIEAGVEKSGVKRLIVIGGAGSLYVGNVQLVDTPQFPKEYYTGASAARDYLNILKENTVLDWTFFSPAIEMNPQVSGTRTGKYRIGLENPVFDENSRSVLSVEDLAVAIVDELENPKHIKQRFTAAY
ncbi:histidine kinase [Arachidicoccus ginsenosidimutans]|uniref:NAD(P)-dependent oxidoreductase n=1 Tax=Arachidicoccus sp. BS20 TaxID=1850526 RepID=UPI0007F12773|nr:NAD(P)H-binding protein [Arachidicoccus sp. BS20]ANI88023.1 histidine kinase [Arachidicoccus sp. BS20]